MDMLFDILILAAVAAVAVSLALGLYTLYRGGEFARRYSNRFMRLRVGLQAVAVLLMIAGLLWKGTQGG